MPENVSGVGIVGLGRSGWDIHAHLLAQVTDRYKVTAACDLEEGRLQEARERFGCNTYGDHGDLLADPAVELVVVATPSYLHAPHSVAALKSGHHVLCEKPMATSVEEADEMIEAARASGCVLCVFQNRRYDQDFCKIRDMIQSGLLGRVLLVRMASHFFQRRRDWQTLVEFGGGIVNNAGAHFLDQALLLIGDEEPQVTCQLAHTVSAGDAEDHAVIVLKCPSGMMVEVELSSCAAFSQDHWFVVGTCGGVKGSTQELSIQWFDPGALPPIEADRRPPVDRKYGHPEDIPWQTETWKTDEAPVPRWTQLYVGLHDAITKGDPPPVTPESVRRQIALIARCKELSPLLDTG